MINFLLFLTIVVGGPAHSEPLIVGERGVVSRNAVACRSLDDVEKIWTLTRKDKAAGEQYTADLMAAEKCIIIYRGLVAGRLWSTTSRSCIMPPASVSPTLPFAGGSQGKWW